MFHSESLFPDPMLFGSATSRFTIDITSLELLYPNQTLLVFPRRRSSTAGSATAGSTLPTPARLRRGPLLSEVSVPR